MLHFKIYLFLSGHNTVSSHVSKPLWAEYSIYVDQTFIDIIKLIFNFTANHIHLN